MKNLINKVQKNTLLSNSIIKTWYTLTILVVIKIVWSIFVTEVAVYSLYFKEDVFGFWIHILVYSFWLVYDTEKIFSFLIHLFYIGYNEHKNILRLGSDTFYILCNWLLTTYFYQNQASEIIWERLFT